MKVRIYESSDLEALKAIHAKRNLPDVCFPDASNPLYFVQRVIEDDGVATAAAFVKLTAEPFLLLDPDLSKQDQLQHLSVLSDVCEVAVRQHQIEDFTCWIPPEAVSAGFGHALEEIGFIRSPWISYTRVLRY